MMVMCKTDDMCKWLSEQLVIEITSVSLMHMVVSFPSDDERRLQLMGDGFMFGDIDGVAYNCLPERVLQLLLYNSMIQVPVVYSNASHWKREECEAVRDHLCSHDDERLRPVQRDQHNCICDVYSDHHKIAY